MPSLRIYSNPCRSLAEQVGQASVYLWVVDALDRADRKKMKLSSSFSAPRFLLAAVAAAAAALLASTVDALDPLVVLDVAEDVRLEHW